jgi:DNA-binding CsgD family transcriptional regulator
MRPQKLIEFLEAAYALELDDEPWLRRVSLAAREVWGRPASILASLYDASDLRQFRPLLVVSEGVPEELGAAFYRFLGIAGPDVVARVSRRFTAGIMSEVAPELTPSTAEVQSMGIADALCIAGSDPNGLGCSISINMPTAIILNETDLQVYRRMSHHLGAAYRCRLRLGARRDANAKTNLTEGAEAVLDPAGKVLHAEGMAKSRSARESLKGALRAFDRARTRGSAQDAVTGMRRHKPLVDARWTLVDTYERDGKRYVVARENQAEVSGLASLSSRERQVAAFLALGRTTKEIAYSLGISDSTTRVLLSRATTKLRVRSRQDLIDLVTREALPGLGELDPSRRDSKS